MRRSALLSTAFSLILGATIVAQQPTFKSGVSLVTVDVTVLDKDGNPVPGLTAADFEIKLGGKVQAVRALAYVQAAPAKDDTPAPVNAKPAAPAGATPAAFAPVAALEVRRTISNADAPLVEAPPVVAPAPVAAAPAPPPAGNLEPRTFVVLIDDLSFVPMRGRNVFAAAQRFINSVPRVDPVGFTTTSGSMTVNPTLDRLAVTGGIAKVVGEYTDPRLADPSGRSAGIGKGVAEREQPLGIEEAMTIERGIEGVFRDVAIRECFHGDSSLLPPGPMDVVAVDNPCVGAVRTEARRTAELSRQTRRRQLSAIASVIGAMRTASGIRHLVIVTDGLALHLDVDELDTVTRAAATAGVQVSMVMEEPDAVSMDQVLNRDQMATPNQRADPGIAKRQREDNRMMLSGAQSTAEALGGIFYKFIGNADAAFGKVLTASSAVYRLAVEVPSGAGNELSVAASVKRPGLTVRTNKLAVPAAERPAAAAATPSAAKPSAPPAFPASIDDVLKTALNANTPLRGVPLRMAATLRRSTNVEGQIDVSVSVMMPASAKTPITALVGVLDDTNAMRISRKIVDNTAAPVQFLFPLAAGNYAIRFGAADADKALGTIELPLAVKLHALGAFTASDVLTYSVGDQSQKAVLFALDDIPAAAEPSTYHASIELYPSGAMPSEPPVIRWSIVREGGATPVAEEEIEGRVGANLFRSDFDIPYATLAPGTYVVRATLLVGDKPAGSAGAVIKKK